MSADPALDAGPEEIRAGRAIEPRPLAWWGMMLTLAVIATMYGAMYFSYFYIRIGVTRWPPDGIAPPALGLPAVSAAALLASAIVLWGGLRRSHRGELGAERFGLLSALVLAGASVALLLLDWTRAGFGVDVHSYAALYYVLPAIHAVVLAIGMLMAVVHLALSFRPEDLPRRAVGLRALGAYWYLVALGGALLTAVVYGTPHVWPVA
ncbi:MAG TPA: hypothetical protein VM324_11510 [Egibacteraceae bacterium]|jgi:heme/copper-type cytochrome/quinol oxidase subunit 3|nr:hypothetical protein [Egibacteraceae bacterium]